MTDTEHRDVPTCPWCGEADALIVVSAVNYVGTGFCYRCKKPITIERHTTTTYTSRKVEE